MQHEGTDQKNCLNCSGLIAANSKFCKHCGVVQVEQDDVSSEERWFTMQQIAIFYAIEIVCCIFSHIDAFKTFAGFIVVNVLLAINKVSFFFYNIAENRAILRWPNFSFQKLCAYCGLALTFSIGVHYSVEWVNSAIWSDDNTYYYNLIGGGRYYAFLIVFFTAVCPAIFEELGFRGYLLQKLLKVVDPQQAVFISSFLFAIIHMSFLSLFWLIPLALFLGYTRIREKTIWYGVFIHFSFNLGACLFELL